MKKRAYITLRIDYDNENEVHPAKWGWGSLLDLPDFGDVEVLADNMDYARPTPEYVEPLTIRQLDANKED